MECSQSPAATCGQDGQCGGGACRDWQLGTVCAAQTCVGNVQHNADTCNGTGTCTDGGTTSCGGYICSGAACLSSCTNDAQCQTAAGYNCRNNQCRKWTTLMAEDFTPIPDNWAIDHVDGTYGWFVYGSGNTTGSPSGGNYAVIDSDSWGPGEVGGLITPVFDLTSYYDVRLTFWHDYYRFSGLETAQVEYSLSGTAGPWTPIVAYTSSHRGIQEVQDVSAAVRGHSTVAFRFWYDDGFPYPYSAWWWAVDDVVLEAR